MLGQLIDGKQVAHHFISTLKNYLHTQQTLRQRAPGLAVIVVGEDPASLLYVRNKRKACQAVGIQSSYYPFPDTVEQSILIEQIEKLNDDPAIDGILLQLPLPLHLDTDYIIESIAPAKDIDGLHAYQLG